jgi:hypothetical protein
MTFNSAVGIYFSPSQINSHIYIDIQNTAFKATEGQPVHTDADFDHPKVTLV